MKKGVTTALLLLAIFTLNSESKKCGRPSELIKKECTGTEYQNYVECVRSRMKRSVENCDESDDYDDENDECNSCDCESDIDTECNSSQKCCKFRTCSTNHCCHKVCHSTCKSSNCRSNCRKTCYRTVRKERKNQSDTNTKEREYIDKNSNSAGTRNSTNSLRNFGSHNITTVIHLKNTINNTNLIDVPINLNNSNVNNVNVESSQNVETGNNTSCCSVIEPKTCSQTNTFPYINCYHLRRQQCGAFCKTPIVHKVVQNVCYNNGNVGNRCGTQILYVPQPVNNNRCNYSPSWPFISCSNVNCNGCYDYMFNNQQQRTTCSSSCYGYNTFGGANCGYSGCYFNGYNMPPPMQMPSPYFGGFGGMMQPIEQFIPKQDVNWSNSLYGVLKNVNEEAVPNEFYGKPIIIDEETFKKLFEVNENGELELVTEKNNNVNITTSSVTEKVSVTSTVNGWFNG